MSVDSKRQETVSNFAWRVSVVVLEQTKKNELDERHLAQKIAECTKNDERFGLLPRTSGDEQLSGRANATKRVLFFSSPLPKIVSAVLILRGRRISVGCSLR